VNLLRPPTPRTRAFLVASTLCLAAIAHATIFSASPRPQSSKIKTTETSSDQSLWRVDLHSLGYPSDSSQLQLRRRPEEFNTVDFVSENEVVATFLTQEPIGLQRRDDPNRARPYLLHALFLDAATGKLLKSLEWPLDNPVSGIFPRYDGSFLFLSTQRLVLYSPNWTVVKELPFSQLLNGEAYFAGLAESPSGKVLVIRFHQNNSTHCIRILTETLSASESACEIPEIFTVSDDEMAMYPGASDKPEIIPITGPVQTAVHTPTGLQSEVAGDARKILISAPGASARNLCDTTLVPGCSIPQFVNNENLVVYEGLSLSLLNHNGIYTGSKAEFAHRLPWLEGFGVIDPYGRPVRPSAGGQKFAVVFNTSPKDRGVEVERFTIPGEIPDKFPNQVAVYDLSQNAWIYQLKNKKSDFKQIWSAALSPAGNKLAIDSGGVIQIYTIPPSSESSAVNH
jgi:hypothetical protein